MICPNCKTKCKLHDYKNDKGKHALISECETCEFTAPQNYMKIDKVYAFVQVDTDKNEGIPAFRTNDGFMPLIAADWDRIESLMPMVREMQSTGHEIKLLEFSSRKELDF